ncbi:MAG: ATP-binding protein [Nitrososphaera sp.]|nr:ATP-binding protein [Nitrososphaera sp.]
MIAKPTKPPSALGATGRQGAVARANVTVTVVDPPSNLPPVMRITSPEAGAHALDTRPVRLEGNAIGRVVRRRDTQRRAGGRVCRARRCCGLDPQGKERVLFRCSARDGSHGGYRRPGCSLGTHRLDLLRLRHSVSVDFGAWGEVFGDRIIASAILEPVLHHTITINVESSARFFLHTLTDQTALCPQSVLKNNPP